MVASYVDSDRMDLTITSERPDHTFHTLEKKGVPIILRDDIPRASIEFSFLLEQDYVGVPTIEAKERGGQKTATHVIKIGP